MKPVDAPCLHPSLTNSKNSGPQCDSYRSIRSFLDRTRKCDGGPRSKRYIPLTYTFVSVRSTLRLVSMYRLAPMQHKAKSADGTEALALDLEAFAKYVAASYKALHLCILSDDIIVQTCRPYVHFNRRCSVGMQEAS